MSGVETRTSSIEGLGLFATRPFSARQRIRQINVVREITPWTAVHRPRFQGVHSHLGHDARPNLAQLPAVEWEAGTVAQIAEKRMHPTGNAAVA